MFRELRRPQGDPKVLAAQSKEEYMKVCMLPFDMVSSNCSLLICSK